MQIRVVGLELADLKCNFGLVHGQFLPSSVVVHLLKIGSNGAKITEIKGDVSETLVILMSDLPSKLIFVFWVTVKDPPDSSMKPAEDMGTSGTRAQDIRENPVAWIKIKGQHD